MSRATFGQGSGPIFLDQVMCRGVEYRLIDCANRGIQVHGCSHSEDAGVRCVTGKNKLSAWACPYGSVRHEYFITCKEHDPFGHLL